MKYFGTDGIRGQSGFFTDDLLQRAAFAAVSAIKATRVAIARDTRISGKSIEDRLIESFLKAGADVVRVGMTPTPVLAYITRAYACDTGIMISASHNPPEYNGIKFFGRDGGKIEEAVEAALEEAIDNPFFAEGAPRGNLIDIDADSEYILHMTNALKPDLKGIRVLIDAANGATSLIAAKLLRAAGAVPDVIHCNTDGTDINENCGATVPKTLADAMKDKNYRLGFTYDGDGDRVMAVKDGKIYDGDRLIYVAARYFLSKGRLKKSAAVGTVMTNLGMEKALEKRGIKLIRTKVGDKYVSDEMILNAYQIGGEASGHVIFRDYQNTGDGLLTSLLTAMIDLEEGIDILDDIKEYPQASRDIKTTPEKVAAFKNSEEIKKFISGFSSLPDGRVVVRASGTEPKIRIMAEAECAKKAAEYADTIRDFIVGRIE